MDFVPHSNASDRFKSAPVEEDTKVRARRPGSIGAIEVVHEVWVWEGVCGESLIFLTEDVAELGVSGLETLARASGLIKADSQVTVSENKLGYTFVNFNFEVG
jgi:hypothetical protein